MDPGELPKGAFAEALKISVDTHQLPLPPHCGEIAEKDFSVIMKTLEEFLANEEDFQFMFTDQGEKGRDVDEVTSAFIRIFEENEENGHQLELPFIINLDRLFYDLQEKAANIYDMIPFKSVNEAREELNKNSDWYMEIGCQYHKAKDALKYCCETKYDNSCDSIIKILIFPILFFRVNRWAYQICHHCSIAKDATSVPQISNEQQLTENNSLDEVSDSESDEDFEIKLSSDDEVYNEAEEKDATPLRPFDFDSIIL